MYNSLLLSSLALSNWEAEWEFPWASATWMQVGRILIVFKLIFFSFEWFLLSANLFYNISTNPVSLRECPSRDSIMARGWTLDSYTAACCGEKESLRVEWWVRVTLHSCRLQEKGYNTMVVVMRIIECYRLCSDHLVYSPVRDKNKDCVGVRWERYGEMKNKREYTKKNRQQQPYWAWQQWHVGDYYVLCIKEGKKDTIRLERNMLMWKCGERRSNLQINWLVLDCKRKVHEGLCLCPF